MVITDMDGTLLNNDHRVSDRFFEIFQELKKRNILFVAASGRQYHSIVDKLNAIKKDIIVVSENGGFIMQDGKEILSTPLPLKTHKEVLSILDNVENIYPVLCGKNKAYARSGNPQFTNKLKEYYTEYELLDDLNDFEDEILKIAIYHFESSEKYIYPAVSHLDGLLKVKISGANWVDISSRNANKGYAIEKVMRLNNIKPEEIVVFGDYNNDLEMLALTENSFAMKNAHANVLEAANYTTTSNDDFGVERILENIIK